MTELASVEHPKTDRQHPAATTDEHLRSILAWHFSPATGSPFWLRKAAGLGFDPLTDITTVADLRRFPDVSEELRHVPVEDLIPEGLVDRTFEVFESGGTTGAPKRVVDATARTRNVDWTSEVLAAHGFPERGHWLHVGPTGPHVVGRTVRRLAELRGAMTFTLDFDPRWVKHLIGSGRTELAAEYREYLLDQVELVVASQNIKVLFITPPVLEALCARPALYDKLAGSLEGILWAGTSISPESLHQIEETFFPNAKVAAIYGNTLMGIAPQRPRQDGDPYPCVFRPYVPQSIVELVDPQSGGEVAYGERGRVLVHQLSQDLFLPNVLERDTAIRVRPAAGDDVDGLADIAPLKTENAPAAIEGVY
ncbi:AMP-binding protein [Kitasatospora sp. NBC_01250]|uniref:AMP-binding protein n=1 Tax=unclassified Kitasatospora TaxID=2633591 RepID=UPI002E0DCEE5|nr:MULTISPECIES: AMP-binding protein [unclassified Kitasatospora]WSJ66490.1 AMP-binding protein [Kitasatospora sp. NBC_01302]